MAAATARPARIPIGVPLPPPDPEPVARSGLDEPPPLMTPGAGGRRAG